MQRAEAMALLYGLSTVVTAGAAVAVLRRSTVSRVALPLAVACLAVSSWLACLFGALLTAGGAREGFLLAIGPVLCVAAGGFLVEVAVLADSSWRPGPLVSAGLAVVPAGLAAASLTPAGRGLALTAPHVDSALGFISYRPGPLFWAALAYCLVLVSVACAIAVLGVARSTSVLRRRQLASVLASVVLPVAAGIAVDGHAATDLPPHVTPSFAVLAVGLHVYAVLRFGVLRLLPVARGVVLENVGDAVFVLDGAGRVIDVNRAGRQLARRLEPDGRDLIGHPLSRFLVQGRRRRLPSEGELRVEMLDGPADLDVRVSELTDRDGELVGRVVVVRDVSELHEQRRRLAEVNERLIEQLHLIDTLRHELAELAVRDELTGLHNRRHLVAQLEAELHRGRTTGAPLAVVLLDIDHFKSVNDRFGHGVGDSILAGVARAIATAVGEGATVARYGGEEFVVLLPDATLDDGLAVAERLRERSATVVVDSRTGPVSATVSAGVAAFPTCGVTSPQLMQTADDALYAAKRSGRNRVVAGLPLQVSERRH